MDLATICMGSYPILKGILENLSASDAFSYLVATRFFFRIGSHLRRKYLNLLRDLPEHHTWIQRMICTGHRVLLVGNDIHKLTKKVNNPTAQNDSLKVLWLLAVPVESAMNAFDREPQSWDNTPIMDWTGQIHTLNSVLSIGLGQNAGLFGPRISGSTSFLTTMFQPPDDAAWAALSADAQDEGWYVSRAKNMNNIQVTSFASFRSWHSGLQAHIVPCHTHAPAAFNVPLISSASQTTLAYYDINSGYQGLAVYKTGSVVHDNLREGILAVTLGVDHPLLGGYGSFDHPKFVIPIDRFSCGADQT